MKKVILMLTIVVLATTLFAQTYTVIDTVTGNNLKLNVVKEGLQRIETTLIKVFDKEKVEHDTMTYLQPTRELITYFNNGLLKYSSLFYKFDTLSYTKLTTAQYQITTGQTLKFDFFLNGNDSTQTGLIHEWDALNLRITALQNDSDIKYVEAVTEFKRIKERQAILEKRYKLILQ